MTFKTLRAAAIALAVVSSPAMADATAVKAMEEYLDFVDYGAATAPAKH
jgi:hypothetical protein